MSDPVNAIDWYKAGHYKQYPDNTTLVVSNFTARKSRIEGINYTVHFGLQYYILKYLIEDWNDNFFSKPKEEVLKNYKRRVTNALGPDAITFEHIEALHDLGYLPLRILSLPEGAKVPVRLPTFILYNTKPEFFWLTNYIETDISCNIWQPSTSATLAYKYRQIFDHWANLTVGSTDFVGFQGHDFSYRGMPGREAAAASGAGHLLSFFGSDTVPAIDFLETYYGADSDKEMVGVSVAATEHSVMCAGGQECEADTIKRLLTETNPTGILSIVSDTWDFWKTITETYPALKDIIMERDGKLVIRPDSGDPVDILCGTYQPHHGDYAKRHQPEQKGLVECLWDTFGGTETSRGFKLLDSHIGAIYGDSITLERADEICHRLATKGFASINWVAGIGSFTYQYVTRDTFGSAIKATYVVVEGEGRAIFKDPKTDNGTKKSAKGLLAVFKNEDGYYLKEESSWEEMHGCEFRTVFEDGKLTEFYTLSDIRSRLGK